MAAKRAVKKKAVMNKGEQDKFISNTLMMQANALLLSRANLSKRFDPEGRDLDEECGYPTLAQRTPTFYWDLYNQVSVANRVVNVFPSECWSVYPDLYEIEDEKLTEFEEAWGKLNQDGIIWNFLNRIDELSGVGAFGILFFGFADGKDPSNPVQGINEDGTPANKRSTENQLNFIRAFDQSRIEITEWETNIHSRRYGLPVMYKVSMDQPMSGTNTDNTESPSKPSFKNSLKIHWTRTLHVADNRKTSEVYGTPRCYPVLPEIMDIRKIRGGSAEMFWRGAFPGYSFEELPKLGLETQMDEDSVREQFLAYANGLQRYLALTGVTAKSLAPQISEPTAHLEQQYRSIASQLGMPTRIFLGSETGHLASSQDAATWNRRLAKRQQIYITPSLVRPFVLTMIMTGVLPQVEDFKIAWNDLNTLSATDKADIALKQTQALQAYVTGGVEQVMSLTQFLTNILGMTGEEAQAIVKEQKRIRKKNDGMFTAQGAGVLVPTGTEDPNAQTAPGNQSGIRDKGDGQPGTGNPGTDANARSKTPARGKGTPNSKGTKKPSK